MGMNMGNRSRRRGSMWRRMRSSRKGRRRAGVVVVVAVVVVVSCITAFCPAGQKMRPLEWGTCSGGLCEGDLSSPPACLIEYAA